jgi:hypothetical protein
MSHKSRELARPYRRKSSQTGDIPSLSSERFHATHSSEQGRVKGMTVAMNIHRVLAGAYH